VETLTGDILVSGSGMNITRDNTIKATLSSIHKIRALNVLILGHVIQEATLWFSEEFGVQNFQASSGCLNSFSKRSLISQRTLRGESNEE
jgi:hypothetical protein